MLILLHHSCACDNNAFVRTTVRVVSVKFWDVLVVFASEEGCCFCVPRCATKCVRRGVPSTQMCTQMCTQMRPQMRTQMHTQMCTQMHSHVCTQVYTQTKIGQLQIDQNWPAPN